MQSDTALKPYNVDVKLVSAVQIHAGARCHEAANLVGCYMLWAELHGEAVAGRDHGEAEFSRTTLDQSEVNLRKFLFQCRHPQWRAEHGTRGGIADGSQECRPCRPAHA
jgi:hypothetical protein